MWRFKLIQAIANVLTYPGRFPTEAWTMKRNARRNGNKAICAAATEAAGCAYPEEQRVFFERLLGPVYALASSHESGPEIGSEKMSPVQ